MMEDMMIGKMQDNVYKITAQGTWAQDVPCFHGGIYDGIYDSGDQCFVVCIREATADDLLRYTGVLEANGYRRTAENEMSGNVYFTYENGRNYVYAYYIQCTRSVRVMAEPYYDYCTFTPEKDIVRPAIIASSACDRNFYVRLPDNTLVVVDGGWRIEDWCLYDHEELLNRMYSEMSEILGGADVIHVSLWFITHAHTDHARVLENLYKTDLKDKFVIDRMLYNFPAHQYLDVPPDPTPEQLREMDENVTRWHDRAGKDYPYERIFYNCPFRLYDTNSYDDVCRQAFRHYSAVQIKAHDGMKLSLSGVDFEVFHTPEDDMPAIFSRINDVSIVVKMTYRGSGMLWLGDMCAVPGTSCVEMYGERLKCDCMQVSHHGWGAATEEFYRLASPSVLFWNNSEFGFKYADKYQGFGKTKNSTDLYNMPCVTNHVFCNRIRMTYAYLPVKKAMPFEDTGFQLIASAVSDRSFCLKLPDGRLILYGCGWRREDWEQYDHHQLMTGMYEELVRISGRSKVHIAAAILPDSYAQYSRFLTALAGELFADSLVIEKVIVGFVPNENLTEVHEETISAQQLINDRWTVENAASNTVADFDEVHMQILFAPDPTKQYASVEDTSLVLRFSYQGQSVLFTGDMTDELSRMLLAKYGHNLRSDAVQVANHGWDNCGVPEFYRFVRASLQMWNNSEYGFQFFRRDEGYRKSAGATEIFDLTSCKLNAFCNQTNLQRFHLPLKENELAYHIE